MIVEGIELKYRGCALVGVVSFVSKLCLKGYILSPTWGDITHF